MRRDLSSAFTGHLVAKSLGLFTFLLITRWLNPSDYGLFMLALAMSQIWVRFAELGFDTAIGSLLSKSLRDQQKTLVDSILKAAFLIKATAGLLVTAIAWSTAPWLAAHVLGRPEVVGYLRIAFLGILGIQMQGFYLAFLGARLEFRRAAVFGALAPIGILAAIALAQWQEAFDVRTCLWIYTVVPLLSCAVPAILLPHDFLHKGTNTVASAATLWSFSRWIYASNLLGSVRYRVNSILLSRLATMEAIGLYNYGDKLVSLLSLISNTIMTVFVPRAAHLSTHQDLRDLLRRSHRWFLYLLPVLVALLLITRHLIPVLSSEYHGAQAIFVILFVSVLFSLLALPSRAVLYAINRPQWETLVETVALVLAVVIGYPLVKHLGGVGGALALLVQRILSAVLVMAAARAR